MRSIQGVEETLRACRSTGSIRKNCSRGAKREQPCDNLLFLGLRTGTGIIPDAICTACILLLFILNSGGLARKQIVNFWLMHGGT